MNISRRLQDKVVLITGAASGLGAATANHFAEEGAIVIIAARDDLKGNQVVDEIKKKKLQAYFKKLDVTDETNWIELVKDLEQQFNKCDVLVNNAGVGLAGSVTSFSLNDWHRTLRVNLDGVFLGTKHIIPLMEKNNSGSIINISSIDGINGVPGASAYCASKGGVCLFTKSVALECAEKKNNIRVNAVCPGSFHSPMVEQAPEWDELVKKMGSIEKAKQARAEFIPLKRLATLKEITNGILFLASDESSYMTGSFLIIDGGISAR